MKLKRIGLLSLLGLLIASSVTAKTLAKGDDKKVPEVSETPLTETQQNEFEYTFIEAIKQKQLGQKELAKNLLVRCLEIDPVSAVCMYELGKLHYADKDLTSAALLLERSVDLNPNNKWYKITLAQVYLQAKKSYEAAEIYAQLFEDDKENVEYLFAEASLWADAKEYERAIDAYNELEDIQGITAQVSLAKQNIYVESGDFNKAVKEMQELIDSAPKEPKYYGLMAELYQNNKDYDTALEYYAKVKEVDPDNGFVYLSLANLYEDKGDYDEAYNNIKLAFESDDLDVDTKMQYYIVMSSATGESHYDTKQVDELIELLHAKYPDDDRMYAVFADHLIRQDKQAEAREYISKYLAKNPESYEMWWQSLMITNTLEEWDRLLEDSKTALTYFPEEASIYVMKAVAELQLEQYEKGMETAKKGVEYTEGNAYMQSQLEVFIADANYELGNVDEAIEAYKKVLEIDPTNYPAMNNLAYYLSQQNRDLDLAENYASKAIQANPQESVYLDTYAWVLFKQGDYELAKFYQETALQYNDGDDGVYFEHYGDILFKLGETDKAVEQWQKAKDLGLESEVLDRKIKEKTYIEEKDEN